MTMFGALPIAASGAEAMQTWIDTSAGNIANMNDAVPAGQPTYAQQTPVLAPTTTGIPGAAGSAGAGVAVTSIALGTTAGSLAYDPQSPQANAKGEVALPAISLAGQLVGMIEAQQSYQADTVAIARAKAAYTAGLTIGS